jgi:hypothetical protein
MAEYAAIELTGSIEGGECPHEAIELLIKNTGVVVGEIRPVVGSKLGPFAELLFTITEDNSDG